MKRTLSLIAAMLASLALDVVAQGLAPDCAAIRAANPAATDGDYIISPGGNTFRVYCHDMAGAPREYLTLVNTGGGSNYSAYGQLSSRRADLLAHGRRILRWARTQPGRGHQHQRRLRPAARVPRWRERGQGHLQGRRLERLRRVQEPGRLRQLLRHAGKERTRALT